MRIIPPNDCRTQDVIGSGQRPITDLYSALVGQRSCLTRSYRIWFEERDKVLAATLRPQLPPDLYQLLGSLVYERIVDESVTVSSATRIAVDLVGYGTRFLRKHGWQMLLWF